MADKIESEEKRERLTGIVECWAKHTKADNMLRDGDVPNLVGQIIEEFYHVQLCCGHWVNDFDDGIHLEFKESDGSTVSGTYCKVCAKEYKKELKAKEIKA